jgi:DNA polymerase delta subunit 3
MPDARILYAFHRKQTSLKPGSIHATYLLCGYKIPVESGPVNGKVMQDGEDTVMQSSPYMSSQGHGEQEAVEIREKTISVVREGDLEGEKLEKGVSMMADLEQLMDDVEARRSYERITSIHIYSLEPAPLQVNILSIMFRSWLT